MVALGRFRLHHNDNKSHRNKNNIVAEAARRLQRKGTLIAG